MKMNKNNNLIQRRDPIRKKFKSMMNSLLMTAVSSK